MPGNFRPASVTPVSLSVLAESLSVTAPAEAVITGVTHASDQVQPGDLYAALPGVNRHGAEFVPQAAAAGAVAVLSDRVTELPTLVVADPREALGAVADVVYGRPTERLTVIGITGTAGKTSTAYLIEAGLRAAGRRTGLLGTVETRLDDLVVKSVRTTPEAPDLHALFAVALERGVQTVVMEVSSHALALGRVGGVRFATGGWTNFGADHLDFHTDSEDYFQAKAKLFDGRCQTEILNLDDPALLPLITVDTVTYSAKGNPEATWRAEDVHPVDVGQCFTAIGPHGTLKAGVSLPGLHNVANALLALASCVAVGIDPQTAADGIAACPGVPGRLERVSAAGPVLGIVDYAHKTDAITAALTALRELAEIRSGRLICVLGAGGDRDTIKRPLMGEAAARGADLVIVSDDNPRTEDPAEIRAAVLAGARRAGGDVEIIEVAGRRAAIDEAVRRARPGDVIALLGKGHETGQEVGDGILPFDDRVELADALNQRFA